MRAQLGAKSEQLLKKGMGIPDVLLVSIMVNAIKYVWHFSFLYQFNIFMLQKYYGNNVFVFNI